MDDEEMEPAEHFSGDISNCLWSMEVILEGRPLGDHSQFASKYKDMKEECRKLYGLDLPDDKVPVCHDIDVVHSWHDNTDPLVAAHLCCELNIQDSYLVSRHLHRIFSTYGHFRDLLFRYSKREPHRNQGLCFAESAFNGSLQESLNRSELSYFIHHSNKAKLVLSNGERFLNQAWRDCTDMHPFEILQSLKNSHLLIFLARHGVDVSGLSVSRTAVQKILRDVIVDTTFHLFQSLEEGTIRNTTAARYWQATHRKAVMLEVLLRVIPYPDFQYLEEQSRKQGVPLPNMIMIFERFSLVPCLKDFYNRPPKLKHLSKCIVRFILYDNFQLPSGIYKLPLKEDLKMYLDLLLD